MTQRMPAARADKTIVEVDVIADDALDRAIWRALEHGIEAVLSHEHCPSPFKAARSEPLCTISVF